MRRSLILGLASAALEIIVTERERTPEPMLVPRIEKIASFGSRNRTYNKKLATDRSKDRRAKQARKNQWRKK